MTYEEALAYLHGLQRFGMKPGLGRTVELLRRVGRPDRECGRIVHITGTSGKGSVSALVEAALRAAGHRVGLYTSPSLERFTERMQVNRVDVPQGELAELVSLVEPHVSAMVAEGHEQPTEFEVTTVVAFLWFARRQVDYLVLEVGLGGRFDATTAIERPIITCITNIGLDHTQWLGPTHEAIASDKAGIIKPGVPCVTGTDHQGALAVIREIALANDAVLLEVTSDDWDVVSFGPEGQVLDLLGARGWYRGVRLALLGRHQAANAAVALRVLELAGVGEEQIRAGFTGVVWPGRLEAITLANGRQVLLDAAHNPAKCEALVQAVREYFPDRRVLLVLGALADKEVADMVRPLLGLADRVWVTTPDSPRRMTAADLAEVCRQEGREVTVIDDVAGAVGAAIAEATEEELVLVTGSFYTVGPARRNLLIR
ncbi:MAG: bifunctional folylpolyglutamate synthase/dihydrofolate synthase [Bacillota bacterium]